MVFDISVLVVVCSLVAVEQYLVLKTVLTIDKMIYKIIWEKRANGENV